MIHYIVQILGFQLLFLMVYDLFLKKETFFNWNRVYLLATPILSIVLPFIKIDSIRQNLSEQFILQLPAVLIGGSSQKSFWSLETLDTVATASVSSLRFGDIASFMWAAGVFVSFGIFCSKLYKISKLHRAAFKTTENGLKLCYLPNTNTAFSFFKSIFLGEQLSEIQKANILLHEKIHIDQHHSIDLLFFEVLRILFWFNPLVYVYQKKMILLQEFTADAKVAAIKGKKAYYQGLLSQVFNTESISFINTFFKHSLIKKRITMLQKSKSRKISQLKYLLLAPLLAGMLVYTSCSDEVVENETDAAYTADTEVMDKINQLSEALMKKGNVTDQEALALQLLKSEYNEGGRLVNTVQEYLEVEQLSDDSGKTNDLDTQDVMAFALIEKPPTFKDCKGNGDALKSCTSQKISKYVQDNFNTKLASKLGLTGRQRISVQFTIDKTGRAVDLRARAPHIELENEVIRVISGLPQMIPGEQDGKKVGVMYSLPILFQVIE